MSIFVHGLVPVSISRCVSPSASVKCHVHARDVAEKRSALSARAQRIFMLMARKKVLLVLLRTRAKQRQKPKEEALLETVHGDHGPPRVEPASGGLSRNSNLTRFMIPSRQSLVEADHVHGCQSSRLTSHCSPADEKPLPLRRCFQRDSARQGSDIRQEKRHLHLNIVGWRA